MIGFKIDKAKGLFFDSKPVMAATSRAERRVLSRFGAFVRKRARTSIRKRKRIAEAGSPPSSHVGLLKKLILFFFDIANRSVIIGPAKLNEKIGDAPHALEEGGTTQVMQGPRVRRVKRTVQVKARPYMGPAFNAELPNVPSLWADQIK